MRQRFVCFDQSHLDAGHMFYAFEAEIGKGDKSAICPKCGQPVTTIWLQEEGAIALLNGERLGTVAEVAKFRKNQGRLPEPGELAGAKDAEQIEQKQPAVKSEGEGGVELLVTDAVRVAEGIRAAIPLMSELPDEQLDGLYETWRELGDVTFAGRCYYWFLRRQRYGELTEAVDEFNQRHPKDRIRYQRARGMADIWELMQSSEAEPNVPKLGDFNLPPSMWFVMLEERSEQRVAFRDQIIDNGWNTTVARLMLRVPFEDRAKLWQKAQNKGWDAAQLKAEIALRYGRRMTTDKGKERKPAVIDLDGVPPKAVEVERQENEVVVRVREDGRRLDIRFPTQVAARLAPPGPPAVELEAEHVVEEAPAPKPPPEQVSHEVVHHPLSDHVLTVRENLDRLDQLIADAYEGQSLKAFENALDFMKRMAEDWQALANAVGNEVEVLSGG